MGTVREQAVDVLARQVVATVSPAELPLFRATASRYRTDPDGTLAVQPRADEALGFGAEAAVVLVTPFALDLARRLLTRLAEKLGDGAADTLAARILARLGASGAPAPAPRGPGLTAEQLAVVAQTTRAEAAEMALPPEQAERLADAVVATLATRA